MNLTEAIKKAKEKAYPRSVQNILIQLEKIGYGDVKYSEAVREIYRQRAKSGRWIQDVIDEYGRV